MLVNSGPVDLHRQPGGPDAAGRAPEKAVIRGDLFMSRRTAANQRVLAVHLPNGSSLLISKSLTPTEAVMTKLRWVLLIVGGVGVAVAAVAGGMVTRAGLRPVGTADRGGRTGGAHRRPAAHPGLRQRRIGQAHRGVQHDAARAGRVPGTADPAGRRRRARAAHPADVAAHQRRTADGLDGTGCAADYPSRRWSTCAPT